MIKIKKEQEYPEAMKICNISSIWKKKGNDFESYRVFFRVTIGIS